MGWFRNLSIGQKFLVSFGVVLTLLALSLTALLFIPPASIAMSIGTSA